MEKLFWILFNVLFLINLNHCSGLHITDDDDDDNDHYTESPNLKKRSDHRITKKVTGYFVPPQTGEYKFYSSCGQACDVFLSGNENASGRSKIISQTKRTHANIFERYPDQASHLIYLKKGKRYFMQANTNIGQSSKSSHVSVGVILPDDTKLFPIAKPFIRDVLVEKIPLLTQSQLEESTGRIRGEVIEKPTQKESDDITPKVTMKYKKRKEKKTPGKRLQHKLEKISSFIKDLEKTKDEEALFDISFDDVMKTLQENLRRYAPIEHSNAPSTETKYNAKKENKGRKKLSKSKIDIVHHKDTSNTKSVLHPRKPQVTTGSSRSLVGVMKTKDIHFPKNKLAKEKTVIELFDALQKSLDTESTKKKHFNFYHKKFTKLMDQINSLKGEVDETTESSKFQQNKQDNEYKNNPDDLNISGSGESQEADEDDSIRSRNKENMHIGDQNKIFEKYENNAFSTIPSKADKHHALETSGSGQLKRLESGIVEIEQTHKKEGRDNALKHNMANSNAVETQQTEMERGNLNNEDKKPNTSNFMEKSTDSKSQNDAHENNGETAPYKSQHDAHESKEEAVPYKSQHDAHESNGETTPFKSQHDVHESNGETTSYKSFLKPDIAQSNDDIKQYNPSTEQKATPLISQTDKISSEVKETIKPDIQNSKSNAQIMLQNAGILSSDESVYRVRPEEDLVSFAGAQESNPAAKEMMNDIENGKNKKIMEANGVVRSRNHNSEDDNSGSVVRHATADDPLYLKSPNSDIIDWQGNKPSGDIDMSNYVNKHATSDTSKPTPNDTVDKQGIKALEDTLFKAFQERLVGDKSESSIQEKHIPEVSIAPSNSNSVTADKVSNLVTVDATNLESALEKAFNRKATGSENNDVSQAFTKGETLQSQLQESIANAITRSSSTNSGFSKAPTSKNTDLSVVENNNNNVYKTNDNSVANIASMYTKALNGMKSKNVENQLQTPAISALELPQQRGLPFINNNALSESSNILENLEQSKYEKRIPSSYMTGESNKQQAQDFPLVDGRDNLNKNTKFAYPFQKEFKDIVSEIPPMVQATDKQLYGKISDLIKEINDIKMEIVAMKRNKVVGTTYKKSLVQKLNKKTKLLSTLQAKKNLIMKPSRKRTSVLRPLH